MAVNKVEFGNTTIIDISDTTAVASNVESGTYFYTNDGVRRQGSLEFVTYYTGTSAPSASLGQDGDIYLQTGG